MKKWRILLLACMLALPAQAQDTVFMPYDMNLNGFEYPYAVRYHAFDAQNQHLRMAYMDIKPARGKDNGKTVVLLHGKNFSGAYWQITIAALHDEGYRVVVPDQIGFGKSTKPENLQYSFAALAAWTQDLLNTLEIGTFTLMGHSMGGMLATRYALMYPQQVQKLVLVNPIGLEDWKTVVPYQTIEQWYKAELSLTPEKIRDYQAAAYFDGNWQPEYDRAIVPQAGWTLHADYPRIAWNSALHYDMIFNQPVVYEFKNLTIPTLLVIGTRDRTALGKGFVKDERVRNQLGLYENLGKAAAALIPQATLVEFEGIGHVPQVEVFDAYIKAVKDFL